MAKAAELDPALAAATLTAFVLPDAAWSRRVSGIMANDLIRKKPELAAAVIVPNTTESYMVSLRIPANTPLRADEFVRQFSSGGGRAKAAGVNHLPRHQLDDFLRALQEALCLPY